MHGILDRFRKKKNEAQNKPPEVVNRIFDLNDRNIHDHYAIKHLLGKGLSWFLTPQFHKVFFQVHSAR